MNRLVLQLLVASALSGYVSSAYAAGGAPGCQNPNKVNWNDSGDPLTGNPNVSISQTPVCSGEVIDNYLSSGTSYNTFVLNQAGGSNNNITVEYAGSGTLTSSGTYVTQAGSSNHATIEYQGTNANNNVQILQAKGSNSSVVSNNNAATVEILGGTYDSASDETYNANSSSSPGSSNNTTSFLFYNAGGGNSNNMLTTSEGAYNGYSGYNTQNLTVAGNHNSIYSTELGTHNTFTLGATGNYIGSSGVHDPLGLSTSEQNYVQGNYNTVTFYNTHNGDGLSTDIQGNTNEVSFQSLGGVNANPNYMEALVTGNNNNINAIIAGDGNSLFVDQSGSGNTAGCVNPSTCTTGPGGMYITGNNNELEVSQSTNNNQIGDVNFTGNSNILNLNQSGGGGNILLYAGNASNGTGNNYIYTNQYGTGSTMSVSLGTGGNNSVTANQSATGSTLNVALTGTASYDTVMVAQNTSHITSNFTTSASHASYNVTY